MKKQLQKKFTSLLSCVICLATLFSGCNNVTHTHNFILKNESSQYLKSVATCQSPNEYYYSCSCGEVGTDTFKSGAKLEHDYSAKVVKEEYIKKHATCITPAVYYMSCIYCGKKGYDFTTFENDEEGACSFTQEIAAGQFIKEEATKESPAVYYKSCVCGEKGTETFFYGDPLKTYTEEEKIPYTPTSLTVTLYDSGTSTYGFTWNTSSEPLRPVIQIVEGTSISSDFKEYPAAIEMATSYNENDQKITYYIAKVQIALEANKTYTYRVYDKYVEIGTGYTTLQACDTKSDSFTFAHLSDSQTAASNKTGNGTGSYYKQTLSQVVGTNDFIVHTGDMVENSKYEGYWKAMLNDNFTYLSRIPVMAISGNHETTYLNGSNEIFKHFNNKIPEQKSTEKGYFYSFVYGNAKFIMINTNDLASAQLKSEQYDWLIQELSDDTYQWKIVAMHNPMYSAGKWGANSDINQISLALRTQLQGIFAEYDVDIVLQGHDHVISRTYPINALGEPQQETWQSIDGINYSMDPNGVIYVMNGPAGDQSRNPYSVDSSLYYYAEKSNTRSWAEFTISGNSMTVTVKYYNSNTPSVYQTWGIVKNN